MSRPGFRLLPGVAVGAFVAALAGHLLDPARILAVRDLARFHLPLRTAFARLAAHGLPEWNPWVGGGQPLLSDPSYSAFYPPTWLALAAGAAWSLDLLVLLHLAATAFGAYLLVRRLGGRPAVAVFGAVAWAGSGPLLSLVHALNHFFGAAWLPWILLATEAAVTAPDRAAARRARLGLAAAFALTLLNGEPVTVLAGGLAAGCWALGRGGARRLAAPRALARVGAAALLAAALAAAQLVPALARLGDSRRAAGVPQALALSWSMPPERLAELVAPRLFGAPERIEEGLYFGWGIHDRDFPFLLALDPGLAVLVLALAALAVWPIPGRGGLAALLGLGVLLALGRHTPLYVFLYEHVPPFGGLRYPEKFFLLAGAALALAGALGLEHLVRERERGRPGVADFPLALAALVATAIAGLGALVFAAPERVADFVAAHAGIPLPAAGLERVLAFCRREAAVALGLAAAVLLLLAAARRSRWTTSRASGAFVAAGLALVAAADLAWHHRGLLATVPAAAYVEPPPLARALPGATRVLWSSSDFDRSMELVPRRGTTGDAGLSQDVARLDPWTGLLFGYGYALSTDYAITYTAPARRALDAALGLWRAQDRERFFRLLGAWATDSTVIRKSAGEIAAELRAGERRPAPATIGPSPFDLPRVRTVAAARAFGDPAAALAAALADGLPLAAREYVAGAPWTGARAFDAGAGVRVARDDGDRLELDLDARAGALVVVATTWDRSWSATADGAPVPVLETAAGYLAVPVPAGARRLELAFRDPWVRVGGAASAATLLGLAALAVARRRTADPPSGASVTPAPGPAAA